MPRSGVKHTANSDSKSYIMKCLKAGLYIHTANSGSKSYIIECLEAGLKIQ